MKAERSTNNSDSVSINVTMCKICFSKDLEDNATARMVSPCKCKGSLRYVHEDCLLRWMKTKFEDRCELCGQIIKFRKHFKPLNQWVKPNLSLWDIIWPFTSSLGLITASLTLWLAREGDLTLQAHRALFSLGLCTIFASFFLMTLTICSNIDRIRLYIQKNQEWKVSQSALVEVV